MPAGQEHRPCAQVTLISPKGTSTSWMAQLFFMCFASKGWRSMICIHLQDHSHQWSRARVSQDLSQFFGAIICFLFEELVLVAGRPYGRQNGQGCALLEGQRFRSEVEVGRRLPQEEFGAHAAEETFPGGRTLSKSCR